MSTGTPPRQLRAGDRFPTLELPAAPEGRRRRLRDASRNAVALLLVPNTVDEWSEALDAITDAAAEIEQWYARIRVVIAADMTEAQLLRDRFDGKVPVFSDPEANIATRVGIAPDHAALLVVDRYGQIYEVTEAATVDELPGAEAIEQWTKFLATQCPECGVIDEPGYGEWTMN